MKLRSRREAVLAPIINSTLLASLTFLALCTVTDSFMCLSLFQSLREKLKMSNCDRKHIHWGEEETRLLWSWFKKSIEDKLDIQEYMRPKECDRLLFRQVKCCLTVNDIDASNKSIKIHDVHLRVTDYWIRRYVGLDLLMCCDCWLWEWLSKVYA